MDLFDSVRKQTRMGTDADVCRTINVNQLTDHSTQRMHIPVQRLLTITTNELIEPVRDCSRLQDCSLLQERIAHHLQISFNFVQLLLVEQLSSVFRNALQHLGYFTPFSPTQIGLAATAAVRHSHRRTIASKRLHICSILAHVLADDDSNMLPSFRSIFLDPHGVD